MAFQEPRRLYDLDWIADGCPGSPPASTNTDDTFGTYASDYLILVIGLAAAVALATDKRASRSHKIFSIWFFVFTGIGYGIAAVLHQILHDDRDHGKPENKIWWKLSYNAVLVGSAGLGVLGNHLLPCKESVTKILDGVVLVIHGAIILLTFFDPQLFVTGVITAVVVIYLLAVWAVKRKWAKALCMLLCLLGFIVQVMLSPSCGDAAYEDCFADCPLPAPQFNHNALFHVLYALGVLGVGILMRLNPDMRTDDAGKDVEGTAVEDAKEPSAADKEHDLTEVAIC